MPAPGGISHDVFSALTAGVHFSSKASQSSISAQQGSLAGHKRKREHVAGTLPDAGSQSMLEILMHMLDKPSTFCSPVLQLALSVQRTKTQLLTNSPSFLHQMLLL